MMQQNENFTLNGGNGRSLWVLTAKCVCMGACLATCLLMPSCAGKQSENPAENTAVVSEEKSEEGQSSFVGDSIGANGETALTEDKTEEQQPYSIYRPRFKKSTSEVEVGVEFDYPSAGPSALVEAVRGYIVDVLNQAFWWSDCPTKPKYSGDMADGQALADYIGQYKVKTLTKQQRAEECPYAYDECIAVDKIAETDNFITYETSMSGSHGGVGWYEVFGRTFSKRDGHKVKILQNTNSESLKKLLIQSVKDELGGSDMLEGSFFQSPVPETEPYLVDGAVVFVYQKYEIGPGALGAPQIKISKKNMLPYLTDEAKQLLE